MTPLGRRLHSLCLVPVTFSRALSLHWLGVVSCAAGSGDHASFRRITECGLLFGTQHTNAGCSWGSQHTYVDTPVTAPQIKKRDFSLCPLPISAPTALTVPQSLPVVLGGTSFSLDHSSISLIHTEEPAPFVCTQLTHIFCLLEIAVPCSSNALSTGRGFRNDIVAACLSPDPQPLTLPSDF